MPRELSLFSVLVPSLLVVVALTTALFVLLDLALSRAGMYRHVWHPALFRAALYASLCSGAVLALHS